MNVHNPSHRFQLQIDSLDGSGFHVTAMVGRERLSEPYAFDVWFTDETVIDPSAVTGRDASLTVSTGAGDLVVAGVVLEFDCDDPMPSGDFTFHAVIGPRFELTRLKRQNQVFGTDTPVDVAALIRGKLDGSLSAQVSTTDRLYLQDEVVADFRTEGLYAAVQDAERQIATTIAQEHSLPTIPFVINLQGTYPQRDHVGQFEESDFDFLSRTCEHYGIFYFFEHASTGETIVFGDSNTAFDATNAPTLSYRQTRGQADDMSVSSFRTTARPVSLRVSVRDYDDQQATSQIASTRSVNGGGFGGVVEYGPNLNTQTEADFLAQIRADEQAMKRVRYHGVSTAPDLRPGYIFFLKDHPNRSLNTKYVVVAVHHSIGDTPNTTGPYENRFEAFAYANVSYRPPRKTPKPRAAGLFNATIDTAADGKRADLDANGRYKVRYIFDETAYTPGKSSAAVNRVQPYGGPDDTGLHMPLLKNTGVVVGYVNGDPDRPLIVGAVPGAATPSVSTSGDATSNRLRTPSGSMLEINDGPEPPAPNAAGDPVPRQDPTYARLLSQGSVNAKDFTTASYMRLGSYVADEQSLLPFGTASKVNGITIYPQVTSSALDSKNQNYSSASDYRDRSLESATEKGTLTSDQQQGNTQSNKLDYLKYDSTVIPSKNEGVLLYSDGDLLVNTAGAAYVRYGTGHGTAVASGDAEYDVAQGQYSLQAAHGVSITAGSSSNAADLNLVAYNYINQKAYGPLDEITYGDSYKNVHGDAKELFQGEKQTWVLDAEVSGKMAASLTMFFGLSSTIKLSAEFNMNASAILGIKLSAELYLSLTAKADFVFGIDYKMVTGSATKVINGVDMAVITSGLKTVEANDTKIVAGIDFKNANIDGKIVNAKFENKMVTIDISKMGIKNYEVKAASYSVNAATDQVKTQLSELNIIV